jgi:acyl-CoA synthetase (NDP forming)
MTDNLESVFSPKSIAVIGASRKKGGIGRGILENLLKYGYKGKLYVVNPNAAEIESVTAYPNILEIPDDVEMSSYLRIQSSRSLANVGKRE